MAASQPLLTFRFLENEKFPLFEGLHWFLHKKFPDILEYKLVSQINLTDATYHHIDKINGKVLPIQNRRNSNLRRSESLEEDVISLDGVDKSDAELGEAGDQFVWSDEQEPEHIWPGEASTTGYFADFEANSKVNPAFERREPTIHDSRYWSKLDTDPIWADEKIGHIFEFDEETGEFLFSYDGDEYIRNMAAQHYSSRFSSSNSLEKNFMTPNAHKRNQVIAKPHDSRDTISQSTIESPIHPPPRTSSARTSSRGAKQIDGTTTTPTRQRPSGSHVENTTMQSSFLQQHESPNVDLTQEQALQHYAEPQMVLPHAHSEPTPKARGSEPQQSLSSPENKTKEPGAIINRVVISDPEVDAIRARERIQESQADSEKNDSQSVDSANKTGKRRQDFNGNALRPKKEVKFGDYVLGQTLGEGEFGKVKLGWKKDGSVQVAIKLIRRETLSGNPSRLPKIYREVNILMGLKHPNIVKLHEMLETDRYIGIVLEYASGGELFDYILHHRYLNDASAKRLFAQLISGVGYLHKIGIVHRDLKLENLLLDRHKNIIITDFGFANTFDPEDDLSDDIQINISNKEFVKKLELDKVNSATGWRRGDLMATSCGSPCYAAPELVVTDGLYTGRKTDVWSCGVILYAMLAGYLPFDDDPANPEGDNINLLYKYIISTPLTFPEYVSPHSRDLLRRMLVPEPCSRADLFEVSRHTWMQPYIDAVAHFTSLNTDMRALPVFWNTPEKETAPTLTRSASVREPSKPTTINVQPVGGLTHQGKIDPNDESQKAPRDKRRTVQVEYVAPQSQTARGEVPVPPVGSSHAAEAADVTPKVSNMTPRMQNPLAQESSSSYGKKSDSLKQQPQRTQMAPPSRPVREPPRSVSESNPAFVPYPGGTIARPNTGGSLSSASGGRLPSRGNSYSQPVAPTVAVTNAHGRLAQPMGPRPYNISAPIPQPEPYIDDESGRRPASQRLPSRTATDGTDVQGKGHKRSSTLDKILNRSTQLFAGRRSPPSTPTESKKPEKKYPPTSMRGPIPNNEDSRPSVESRRSRSGSRRTSFGFNRNNSDISRQDRQDKPRRFSFLPASFSLRNFSTGSSRDGSKEASYEQAVPQEQTDEELMARQQAPTYDDTGFYHSEDRGEQELYPEIHDSDAYMPRNVSEPLMAQPRARVLQKTQRNFSEAYGHDDNAKHSGTSGPARRVMDFFRRRGKARSGEEE